MSWALFSKSVLASAVFIAVAASFACSAILKFGLGDLEFVLENKRVLEVAAGTRPASVHLNGWDACERDRAILPLKTLPTDLEASYTKTANERTTHPEQ